MLLAGVGLLGAMWRTFLPSGIRHPHQPKIPHFGIIFDIHFWQANPKILMNAPVAQLQTNLEGECPPENQQFLVKIFKKTLKRNFHFVACFFIS